MCELGAIVEKITLGPSDLVVLRFQDKLTSGEYARLQEIMIGRFPGHEVLVLEAGADLTIVRKPTGWGQVEEEVQP